MTRAEFHQLAQAAHSIGEPSLVLGAIIAWSAVGALVWGLLAAVVMVAS